MNKNPQALIFDFFGVMATDIAETWFQKHFPIEEARRLKPQYCEGGDLGEISVAELLNNLSILVQTSASDVEQEWREILVLDYKVIKLIKELKLKYKIGLCSNVAASFILPILQDENLKDLFDVVVISSEIKIIKPSPEIYLETLKRLAVSAPEALFIDDNEVNIKGAEAVGIKGILFKTADQLDKELKLRGINKPE